jgi:hypothetical protein
MDQSEVGAVTGEFDGGVAWIGGLRHQHWPCTAEAALLRGSVEVELNSALRTRLTSPPTHVRRPICLVYGCHSLSNASA